MRTLMQTALILIGCVSLSPVLAQPPKAPSEGSSVADAIIQRDHDWANAMIAGDVGKLDQIVADEWIEGYPGKGATKTAFLEDVKSGKHKLVACEFGTADVKVFGNVAVLQGSVTEKRISDGQSSTFRVGYMDVWLKRGDSWVVIRSFAKKL